MLNYLLVFFLFLPSGVGMVKVPQPSEAACQAASKELLAKATANNVPAVGTCVTPEDFLHG